MKSAALVVSGIAVAVALSACGSDEPSSAAPPTRTVTTTTAATQPSAPAASATAQQSEMAAMAKGVVNGQATTKGASIVSYGAPQFPDDLTVILPAEVVMKGEKRQVWWQVFFVRAGETVMPFGSAKVAMSENGPWL